MAPVADRHDVWKGVCTLNLKFCLASCERTLMSPASSGFKEGTQLAIIRRGDAADEQLKGETLLPLET